MSLSSHPVPVSSPSQVFKRDGFHVLPLLPHFHWTLNSSLSDFSHDLKHRAVSARIPLLHPVGTYWFSQLPLNHFYFLLSLAFMTQTLLIFLLPLRQLLPLLLFLHQPVWYGCFPSSHPLSHILFCSPNPHTSQMTVPAPKIAVNLLERENPQIHSPAPRWPLCYRLNQSTLDEPQTPKSQHRQNWT